MSGLVEALLARTLAYKVLCLTSRLPVLGYKSEYCSNATVEIDTVLLQDLSYSPS